MTDLWVLLRWFAETIYTADYTNQWAYQLYEVPSVKLLLKHIGQELLQIFPLGG